MCDASPSTDLPPIYVIGYPGSIGGACTELWHTLKLWRQFGQEVHLVPTWSADRHWRSKCDEIGCHTHDLGAYDWDTLRAVPGLAGATIISFCNENFLLYMRAFRKLHCRVIWVNCMNWLFPEEKRHYRRHGPLDAYVFQSRYQQRTLMRELARYDVSQHRCHRIAGAFDVTDYPFCPRPHTSGDDFYVGRLSRPDLDKYSSNTWPIYSAIPYSRRRARVLGWSPEVETKLGRPPAWAEVMSPGKQDARSFVESLHCLLHVTGGSRENWPRCALEAMALGVPIVAEDDFGWPEMIEHGTSGLLGRCDQELSYYAARLAYDEPYRLEMALAARRRLSEVLARPRTLWRRWRRLFEQLAD